MYCKKLAKCVFVVCVLIIASNSALLAEDYDGPIIGNVIVGGVSSVTTANFLPGTETSGFIQVNDPGEVHLYGGTFNSEWGSANEGWYELTAASGEITVHGTKFWGGGQPGNNGAIDLTNAELIPESASPVDITTYTAGPIVGGYSFYNIAWEHHDGTIYNIWMDADVPIYLSSDPFVPEPDPEPEIEVYPDVLTYDYGDIEIGLSETYVVQILNTGTADLNVTSIALSGSSDFVITSEPNAVGGVVVIAPGEYSTDIEITFTPSAEDLVQATLMIASNDANEPSVDILLTGVGVIIEVPVEQQIQETIDFFDQSIADGTILGYAPNQKAKAADNRVKALNNMLKAVGRLIEIGEIEIALNQLESIAKKTDGEKRPPDFVIGDSVAALNQRIDDMITALSP